MQPMIEKDGKEIISALRSELLCQDANTIAMYGLSKSCQCTIFKVSGVL